MFGHIHTVLQIDLHLPVLDLHHLPPRGSSSHFRGVPKVLVYHTAQKRVCSCALAPLLGALSLGGMTEPVLKMGAG